MSYYNTGSTYPYGAYPSSGYAQTPGAYPTAAYQTGYPTAGYTSTWPYPYSYYPHQQTHQQQPAVASRPPVAATPSTTASSSATPAVSTATAPIQVAPQRPLTSTSTFTYAPSHTREALGGGSSLRSFRKQASHRGLFTKERTSLSSGVISSFEFTALL